MPEGNYNGSKMAALKFFKLSV